MPSLRCPYCRKETHVTERSASAVISTLDPLSVSAAFECDNCHHLLIAKAYVHSVVDKNRHEYRSQALNESDPSTWTWEPRQAFGQDYPDVPEAIASPASEAHECFSVRCYRAAVLMARAVLEATAKDKGVATGNLYDKISKLSENGTIRPLVADAAHEVRLLGNDMAHGDFATTQITEDDAEEVLELMDSFLTEVYELPTRIARRREGRSAS